MNTLRLAPALRQALVVGYPHGSRHVCTTNHAVHVLLPRHSTPRQVGTFEGQPHEWAQVGDLFVHLEVKIPTAGSPELRKALEQLDEALPDVRNHLPKLD